MSRGLGQLQQTLLAKLRERPKEVITAHELTAEVLEGAPAAEVSRRWHTTNVSVRRALAGLAKAGLIAKHGRNHRGRRRMLVGYTAHLAILQDQDRQRADAAASQARLRALEPKPRPRLVPVSTGPVDEEDGSGRAA